MIIGIGGKIGSGKDTVGKIIQYLMWNPTEADSPMSFDMFLGLDNDLRYVNSKWEIKKFAYKLKQIVSLLTNTPLEDLELPELKNKYLGNEWTKNGIQMTYRSLLQKIGTEAMRDVIHPDIWVNSLFSEYKVIDIEKRAWNGTVIDYTDCFPKWIITDVRFENEADAIKKRGGILIKIERPNDNNDDQHSSETSLNDIKFDYTVTNDGTLYDLKNKITDILQTNTRLY
jgi:hypothetical protein